MFPFSIRLWEFLKFWWQLKCGDIGQGGGHWILGFFLSGDNEREKTMSSECGFLSSQQHSRKKSTLIFLSSACSVAIIFFYIVFIQFIITADLIRVFLLTFCIVTITTISDTYKNSVFINCGNLSATFPSQSF